MSISRKIEYFIIHSNRSNPSCSNRSNNCSNRSSNSCSSRICNNRNTVVVVFFQKFLVQTTLIIIITTLVATQQLVFSSNWTLGSNLSKILMTLNPLVLDHNRKQQKCKVVI